MVNTIDLSAFSHQYTAALDFTTLKQVVLTDTTANTSAVNYALNGLTAVTVLGSEAIDTFDINAVTGSTYNAAAGYNNILTYQNDPSDTLTFAYNGITKTGTVSDGTHTDIIDNFQTFDGNAATNNYFNLTNVSNDVFNINSVNAIVTLTGGGGSNTFNNLHNSTHDTFSLTGSYTLILTGGGNISFVPTVGNVANNVISLDTNNYTVTVNNDGGNNTFNLNTTGAVTDTFNNVANDTFNLFHTNTTLVFNADGGANIFNLNSHGGSDTLTGLNGDSINLDAYSYTLTLAGETSTLGTVGNVNNTVTGGDGTSTIIASGVYGNAYNLAAGNNVINYTNDTTDNLTVTYDGSINSGTVSDGTHQDSHQDSIENIQTFYGNNHNDTFTLTSVGNDVFNTYGGTNSFTFTLSGGVTTDLGGNTFNLYNGGSNSFSNLNTVTPDTINVNSSYNLTFSGGADIIVEDNGGASALSGNTINLDNGSSYSVVFTSDGGNNQINLGTGSSNTFTGLHNTSDSILFASSDSTISLNGSSSVTLAGAVDNETINLNGSTNSIVVNNDQGGNTFNLSGGGTDTLTGINGQLTSDFVNLDGHNYSITLTNNSGGNQFSLIGGSTDTLTNLKSDSVNLDTNSYTLTLNNATGINTFNLGSAHSVLSGITDTFNGTVSKPLVNDIFKAYSSGYTIAFGQDGGGNTINLLSGGGSFNFTGLQGDLIALDNNSYSIDLSNGDTNDTFTGGNGNITFLLSNVLGNTYNLAGHNTISYQSDPSDTLTFTYDGISQSGTVTDGTHIDTIKNFSTFSGNAQADAFYLTSVSNSTFNIFGNNNTITMTTDGGGNLFNINSGFSIDTFANLNGDTINLIGATYLIMLTGGGSTTIEAQPAARLLGVYFDNYSYTITLANNIGNNVAFYTINNSGLATAVTDTFNGLVQGTTFHMDEGNSTIVLNDDGGNNTFGLYAAGNQTNTFTNLSHDFFDLRYSGDTIVLNNDQGQNRFDLRLTGGGTATFENLNSVVGDTINISFDGVYTIALEGGGKAIFENTSSGGQTNFTGETINLGTGDYTVSVIQDGGGNTFNLLNGGGSDSFNNLNGATPDTINLDGVYTLSLVGGGKVILEKDAGASNLISNTINLDNNAYAVTLISDQGSNIFNLNNTGAITDRFTGAQNDNFYLSHTNTTVALNSDGSGNTFNLTGIAGTDTFTDLVTDTINVNASGYTLNLETVNNTLTSNITLEKDLGTSLFTGETINLYSDVYTNITVLDNGANTFNLRQEHANSLVDTFTNVDGDTIIAANDGVQYEAVMNGGGSVTFDATGTSTFFLINLDNNSYNVTLNNGLGNHIFTFGINNGGADTVLTDVLNGPVSNANFAITTNDITLVLNNDGGGNFFNLIGSISDTYANISGDKFQANHSGDTIIFDNDLGNNTFRLLAGGTLTVENISATVADTISILSHPSAYTITLLNGGDVILNNATGVTGDTINFDSGNYTFTETSGSGGNIYNVQGGGTETFSQLSGDTINLDNSAYTLTLNLETSTLGTAGHINNTVNGGNGSATIIATAVYGNKYNLASGGNTINYTNDTSDTLAFVYNGSTNTGTVSDGTHQDTIKNIQTFDGNAQADTFTLTNVGGDVFNTYGNGSIFTFTLSGGVTTDLGGNTFNLHGGGSYTFNNLNTVTPDTINFNSAYTITLVGGGSVILEDEGGSAPLTGENIILQGNNSYTINTVNDTTGGSTFTLAGGTYSFNHINNETLNLSSSGAAITMLNDGGSNQFNLQSQGGSYSFTNLGGDIINLADNISPNNYTYSLNLYGDTTATLESNSGNSPFGDQNIYLFGNNNAITINHDGTSANSLYLRASGTDTFTNLNGGNDGIYLTDNAVTVNLVNSTVNFWAGGVTSLAAPITDTFNGAVNTSFGFFASGYTISMLNSNNNSFLFQNNGNSFFIETFQGWVNSHAVLEGDFIITIPDGSGNAFYNFNTTTFNLSGVFGNTYDNFTTGLPNILNYQNDTSDSLTFNYDGSTNAGTVSVSNGGLLTDIIDNIEIFGGASGGNNIFNLTNDGGGYLFNLYVGGTDTFSGLNGDTINVDGYSYNIILQGVNTVALENVLAASVFTNEVIHLDTPGSAITIANDGGYNLINVGTVVGTDTFTGFTSPTPNDIASFDVITLPSGFTLDFYGNTDVRINASNTFSNDIVNLNGANNSIVLQGDQGSNHFNLFNGNTAIFTGTSGSIQNDFFTLDSNSYSVTLINDGGGNTFTPSLANGNTTFYGVNGDTFNLQNISFATLDFVGNGSETINHLTSDVINLSGNYDLTFNNEGGGNTFNLTGGGSDSFSGLNPIIADTFNLNGNNPYAIALNGGGNAIFENISTGPLSHDVFQLTGNYTIGVNDDGGDNVFNLNGGGIYAFTTLNNQNNSLFSGTGDTINLDNNNYTLSLSHNVISDTLNGGSGINTIQFLDSALGNNTIDAGTSGNNTADFSQFATPNGDVLNLDLSSHSAYLTNNSVQVGLADTVLNFNNVKIPDVSTHINGDNQTVVDLSALGSALNLTSSGTIPDWTHLSGLTVGLNQNLSIDANNVDTMSANHTVAVSAAASANGTLTAAGGWTETGVANHVANGHTYDTYTATVGQTTETLFVDEHIHNRNIH